VLPDWPSLPPPTGALETLSLTTVLVVPVSIAPVAIRIAPMTTATSPPRTPDTTCDDVDVFVIGSCCSRMN
jgi:hypothetical protein